MNKTFSLVLSLFLTAQHVIAENPRILDRIVPASIDIDAVRDASTLETKVIQDWMSVPKEPTIRQKLIEITVCE